MSEIKHTEGQWPNAITSGDILYGKASNYDGFYLADASHGIPTFGSVSPSNPLTIRSQHVQVFNYPGQTEAIAAQLVERWNAFPRHVAALAAKDAEIERLRKVLASYPARCGEPLKQFEQSAYEWWSKYVHPMTEGGDA